MNSPALPFSVFAVHIWPRPPFGSSAARYGLDAPHFIRFSIHTYPPTRPSVGSPGFCPQGVPRPLHVNIWSRQLCLSHYPRFPPFATLSPTASPATYLPSETVGVCRLMTCHSRLCPREAQDPGSRMDRDDDTWSWLCWFDKPRRMVLPPVVAGRVPDMLER